MVALYYFDFTNLSPFMDEEYGIKGIFIGTTCIYYGYLGFDSVAAVAEETKDASKTQPKAINHSVLILVFIYFSVAFLCAGVGRLTNYESETAMAMIFTEHGANWMSFIMCNAAFIGITISCFIDIIGQ